MCLPDVAMKYGHMSLSVNDLLTEPIEQVLHGQVKWLAVKTPKAKPSSQPPRHALRSLHHHHPVKQRVWTVSPRSRTCCLSRNEISKIGWRGTNSSCSTNIFRLNSPLFADFVDWLSSDSWHWCECLRVEMLSLRTHLGNAWMQKCSDKKGNDTGWHSERRERLAGCKNRGPVAFLLHIYISANLHIYISKFRQIYISTYLHIYISSYLAS